MHILITGGAGFIGSALARHLAAAGHTVTAVDNHSRQRLLAIGTVPPANGKTEAAKAAAGTPDMDRWRGLEKNCRCVDGDINDAPELFTGLPRIDAVVHCAGQVGIASSLADPAEDARNNITGTVQLLEALRRRGERPPVVFFSSNKVYGDAVNRLAAPAQGREAALLTDPWADGISETFPAAEDGLTPYGCSKRAAELYLLDAARRERFPAYILRCSCIYGPGQSGAEDQGWVSHVIRRRAAGGTVRVFGDGRQTRDLLYIDDLADLVARLVPGAVPGPDDDRPLHGMALHAGHSGARTRLWPDIRGGARRAVRAGGHHRGKRPVGRRKNLARGARYRRQGGVHSGRVPRPGLSGSDTL